jgi:hypothetical protein
MLEKASANFWLWPSVSAISTTTVGAVRACRPGVTASGLKPSQLSALPVLATWHAVLDASSAKSRRQGLVRGGQRLQDSAASALVVVAKSRRPVTGDGASQTSEAGQIAFGAAGRPFIEPRAHVARSPRGGGCLRVTVTVGVLTVASC